MKIFARADNGVETEVTEGVQALYDQYMSTMDIGSGLITIEEAEGIHVLAQACQFQQIAEIEKYIEAKKQGKS